MAKKRFKLTHHEAFIFEGDKGEYEIPPLEQIPYRDWSKVAALINEGDVTENLLDECKALFLKVCPDLENEEIGDNQWLMFGNAYFEAMGE